MIFPFDLYGQEVLCTVTHYSVGCPLRVTGSGFGDAEPPEDEEFEFFLKDADGILHDDHITEDVESAVLREYKRLRGIK